MDRAAGSPWRYLPGNLPPWEAVYPQTQRWIDAGAFEAAVHDLRLLMRISAGRSDQPSAAVFDSRTQHPRERASRRVRRGQTQEGEQGAHGRRHAGAPLDAARYSRRRAGPRPGETHGPAVQPATDKSVELAYVDQGYTGEQAAVDAAKHGIRLKVVKLPYAKRGIRALARRRVVERSFAWLTRCRPLAKDYERRPSTVAGLHPAFAFLLPARLPGLVFSS